MKRVQPYFRLNKKKSQLECWYGSLPRIYDLAPEEIPIVETLIERDFMTALLYRTSRNMGISNLCNDIITQRG